MLGGKDRHMELRNLITFIHVADLGSFTKAADRLGYTQSGLTHMMHALEKEVGFSLLIRDRYGVRLTAEGERLLPAIRDFQQSAKRLLRCSTLQKILLHAVFVDMNPPLILTCFRHNSNLLLLIQFFQAGSISHSLCINYTKNN